MKTSVDWLVFFSSRLRGDFAIKWISVLNNNIKCYIYRNGATPPHSLKGSLKKNKYNKTKTMKNWPQFQGEGLLRRYLCYTTAFDPFHWEFINPHRDEFWMGRIVPEKIFSVQKVHKNQQLPSHRVQFQYHHGMNLIVGSPCLLLDFQDQSY